MEKASALPSTLALCESSDRALLCIFPSSFLYFQFCSADFHKTASHLTLSFP